MVSLWPFAARDSSPASFEKALSTLAKKITETQARLERMRVKSRKAKVIGTLYLTFAYLVYAIVLLLVVGYKNLGPYEWTGMAGGPVVIYTARQITMSYYNLVMDSLEARLTEHQDERSRTIQKLKDATRYDSTMELIEKYGGPEGRPKSRGQESSSHDGGGDSRAPSAHGTPGRTHIPPPATANIQRREAQGSRPSTPQAFPAPGGAPAPGRPRNDSPQPSAEFAPNAFGPNNHNHQQQQQQQQLHLQQQHPPQIYVTGPPEAHWYDRIFDVLLGEDETAAKNRIVLICRACRLVNGQAPPGTKTLAELGSWRCMACGAPNGEMDEGKRIVREVLTTTGGGGAAATATTKTSDGDNGDDAEQEGEDNSVSKGPAATGAAASGAKAKSRTKSKSKSKSRGKARGSDEDTPDSAS